jgi:uncharacterized tellurite resistance protein B-like protein
MLSTILKTLGFDVEAEPAGSPDALDQIADALAHMEPADARYVAALAYLLSRVAHADHEMTDLERDAIERVLVERAGLSADRASVVARLASGLMLRVRGTQDFLVAREFAAMASQEQKRALVESLFAVSASDAAILTIEDNEIRRVASAIGVEHAQFVEIRGRYRDRLAVLKKPD